MNLQRPHVRTRSPLPIPTDAIVAAASSARGDDPFNDTANAALARQQETFGARTTMGGHGRECGCYVCRCVDMSMCKAMVASRCSMKSTGEGAFVQNEEELEDNADGRARRLNTDGYSVD